jgi:hypothetical protein
MKTLYIPLLTLLLILCLTPTSALSQDTPIWTNGYHQKLGRVDSKGIISDDSNIQTFGKKIGRIKNGIIYNDPNGGLPVGRIEKKEKGVFNIYDSAAGGKTVGRWEGGKIYDRGSYGGKIIGVSKNKDGAAYFLLKEKIDKK